MPKKMTIRVPVGRGVAWWTALTADQKKALVYPRLKAGETNPGIAAVFGITPNSIASQRNKWNNAGKPDPYELEMLPEQPAPEKSPRKPAPKPERPATIEAPSKPGPQKASPEPPRVQESVMNQTTPQQKPAPQPTGHKPLQVAASHRTQCDHEFLDELSRTGTRQCAFVATVKKGGKQYCENHAHLH